MDFKKKFRIAAIIPARGGSKGFPQKNIADLCGHPLIGWSISQSLNSEFIGSTWVTSDSQSILDISKTYGANTIKRPIEFSSDTSSSESAWIHAIDYLYTKGFEFDVIVGMQCTSPVRETKDLDNAIKFFIENNYDSLLSVSTLEDSFTWAYDQNLEPYPINYGLDDRKPRQKIKKTYLENGSFYLFKPKSVKSFNNRLSGKIGLYVMDKYKSFQVDEEADLKICSAIIKEFQINIK